MRKLSGMVLPVGKDVGDNVAVEVFFRGIPSSNVVSLGIITRAEIFFYNETGEKMDTPVTLCEVIF